MPARYLVIAGQELEDAFRQVEVAPMGSSQVRMPPRVVQEQESASAQHFARAPSAGHVEASDRCKQACGAHPHEISWRRAVWF